MGSPRTPPPCPPNGHRGDDTRDAMRDDMQVSPQPLLSPDSLRPELPSRRLLFAYQHVFLSNRKSPISPSMVRKKIIPKPQPEPNAQPKSIMALKFDRLKDKLRYYKARVSPAVFRFAGHIFLILMLIVIASVIIGWYGLSKNTIAHSAISTKSSATATAFPDYHASMWPTPTTSQDQLRTRGRRGAIQTPTITTSTQEIEKVTIVHTIIITVTSILTDTALRTLTTTVFLSTSTTSITTPTAGVSESTTRPDTPSEASTTKGLMTGIMYCSFTGRRNIYTLCPVVHADSPAMLPSAPALASSATPRVKNPFSAVRVAFVSLWSVVPSIASVMHPESQSQPRDENERDCDCVEMSRKLDSAVDLMRIQQKLLDSQRAIIDGHRKSLFLALEALANFTAAREGGDKKECAEGGLDLKI